MKDSLNFSGDLTGTSKCGMMRKNEKQENPMPNDLPTDRLPTMAETRAMHEQAVRARKKQRLQIVGKQVVPSWRSLLRQYRL